MNEIDALKKTLFLAGYAIDPEELAGLQAELRAAADAGRHLRNGIGLLCSMLASETPEPDRLARARTFARALWRGDV